MIRGLVILLVVAAATPVFAQPAATPPTDDVWRAYDAAFTTAAAGDTDAAKAQLLQLQTRWPQHPASLRAGAITRTFATRIADPNGPSKVARGELVFWSTIGGVFIGANMCNLVGCATDREYAAVYMASVGGALGLAVLASHHGVRNGEAQLYNSSQTWGGWNGIMLANETNDDENKAAIALASQGVGLLGGIGLWQTWRPTQGDVALTNSVFLWTTMLTVWGHLAAGEDTLTLRRVVLAGDAGIVAGALISTQVKMSRGRTLLIDLGGILGILAGGIVAVSTDSERAAGTALFVGTAGGLVLATVASDEWDVPNVSTPVSPMPIAG
ncbi:MAG: hypothetical protein ABI867_31255, partial [Kofleriaceae bacterium]